jgi:hypothetical protein
LANVRPFAAADLPAIDLQVTGITTVEAQRTYWDKVVILPGLRAWYDRRGQLRHGGQRVSRHYFDVFRLLQSPLGERAIQDRALGADCARHAKMFFNGPDFDLDHAVAGTFTLVPPPDIKSDTSLTCDAGSKSPPPRGKVTSVAACRRPPCGACRCSCRQTSIDRSISGTSRLAPDSASIILAVRSGPPQASRPAHSLSSVASSAPAR